MSSYDFFQLLYEDDEFMKKLLIGTKFVDRNSKEWLIKPSIEKAYKIFYKKHFSTFKDRKTGFIYLHGEHGVPSIAQEILKEVLSKLNEYIRSKDVKEAHAALKYIEGKIASANTLDVKKVLASLAEGELQVIALSEASDDFVFKIIQSPFLPETKDRPHRSRMVLAGGLVGFIISFILVLLANFFNKKIGLQRSFPFFLTKAP
jgi:capsule polysaccharide export protein KpsE/RkpR